MVFLKATTGISRKHRGRTGVGILELRGRYNLRTMDSPGQCDDVIATKKGPERLVGLYRG